MVDFDPATHTYRLDGVVLPSVTQVLKDQGFINGQFYDDYGRERGRIVHLCCHLDDTGELDDDTVDLAILPYLTAYRRFKEESGFIVSASEESLASATYRFAGTLDRRGSFKDCTCALLDLKSGVVEPWTAIQLSGYQILADSPYRRFGLQLKADGKYKLTEFKDRGDRNIFLAALAVYHWRHNNLTKGAA